MIELSNYIAESSNELSNILKDDKVWNKISSSEFGLWLSHTPSLYSMIPYKELGLSKPNGILLVIKREGPRWVSIIKWTSSDPRDKQIYVCNGWKYGEYDINDLKIKIHEIIEHLSKSSAARKEFKEIMMRSIDVLKLTSEYTGNVDAFMKYDSIISINSLEDLLNY